MTTQFAQYLDQSYWDLWSALLYNCTIREGKELFKWDSSNKTRSNTLKLKKIKFTLFNSVTVWFNMVKYLKVHFAWKVLYKLSFIVSHFSWVLRKVFRGSKYNQEVETLPSRGGGIWTRISPSILCIVQVHEWLFKTTIWVQLLPYEDSAYVGSQCAGSLSCILCIPSWEHQKKEVQPGSALVRPGPALLSIFWDIPALCEAHVESLRSFFPMSSTVTLKRNLCPPLVWQVIKKIFGK